MHGVVSFFLLKSDLWKSKDCRLHKMMSQISWPEIHIFLWYKHIILGRYYNTTTIKCLTEWANYSNSSIISNILNPHQKYSMEKRTISQFSLDQQSMTCFTKKTNSNPLFQAKLFKSIKTRQLWSTPSLYPQNSQPILMTFSSQFELFSAVPQL